MSKFRTIRLPEGTPGLKVEDVQKDQHPSAAVGAESDTPAKQADRKLAEFIIKTYQKDIFVRAGDDFEIEKSNKEAQHTETARPGKLSHRLQQDNPTPGYRAE
ncbi:hypothetical protein MY5147_008926 [Beauveria neobassiana]|uniref:Uncharacterized protein n=1 Tax=Beauveria bassiana D1-5 TaxID=1245745 RepID=A0A0A2VAC8_BEABA|nr:hypothetical protein BBAD15_g11501 [Beauveria bassiana D1-5]